MTRMNTGRIVIKLPMTLLQVELDTQLLEATTKFEVS